MLGTAIAIIATVLPFFYLFTQQQVVGNFTYAFANIAGFIGGAILLWEFILGIKEISTRLAITQGTFIKLHIILGVWGLFFVFVHPILEMFVYVESLSFLFLPSLASASELHITYGRMAFLLVILVWLTSSFLRNTISYNKWLTIHYLSYPMLFFVFIHALEIGSFMNAFIVIKAYWIALFIFYCCLCIWRVSVALHKKI